MTITIEQIQVAVADFFNLPLERDQTPRQEAGNNIAAAYRHVSDPAVHRCISS